MLLLGSLLQHFAEGLLGLIIFLLPFVHRAVQEAHIPSLPCFDSKFFRLGNRVFRFFPALQPHVDLGQPMLPVAVFRAALQH